MITSRSVLSAAPFLVASCTLVASACDNRLVLGDSPNGGGAGSAVSSTPLPISGNDALTRVATTLWNSPPDAALLSQASQIRTVGDLHGIIQQMLADPRASAGVGAFYRWWLNLPALAQLSKDTSVFPAYTPELQNDMALETETFGVNVTLAMNGSYRALLTAGFSFINARLADIYGVTGVSGDTLQQITLPAGQRAGLLTQPALQALGSVATRNSPPHRGDYVEARFLCQQVGPPPPTLNTRAL